MSRSFRTLTSVIALALALSLGPLTAAQASNTWDAIGSPITGPAGSSSGTSVAMSADGSIVAVGSPEIDPVAPGRVKVYQLSSGTWTQLGADIVGAANGDHTGWAVALSSDGLTVAVGSPRADPGGTSNAGVVRVYRFQSGAWAQLGADMSGATVSETFGSSVALSATGNRVAIGVPRATGGTGPGRVLVFDYSTGADSWSQIGATLQGEVNFDMFGNSVSLSDDGAWLAVGAPKNDLGGTATDAGRVKVFELVTTTWTQRGADIDGEVAGDIAGQSVSLSAGGQRLVVGSPESSVTGFKAGRARVFDYTGSSWDPIGGAVNGELAGDTFGWAVDINGAGDRIAVSSRFSDVPGASAGSVTVFSLISGAWSQLGQTVTGTNASDQAGYALAMNASGDRLAIGAPVASLPSDGSGQVRIFGFTAATSQTAEASPGQPGIYMHIAGPVGRSVEDSPIYVGSDRVAKSSNYTLMLRRVGGLFVTLAAGQVDARGNAEMRITLPTLAPGDYMVTFRGTHANGTGLKLTNYITVGSGGTYLVIEENQPGTW
ncbi:MAG: hypothetical protein K9G09_04515 [Pontimonas sp.]|nr:hypothetical protein [Pontimonas sp.]